MLQALAASVAGAVLTVLVAEPHWQPDTSLRTSLLSMTGLSAYLLLFAHGAYQRTLSLNETRVKLRQSEQALQQQIEAIRALQDLLTEQANRDPLIDADHFKQINDTHGHAAGDEVLKALAALLGTDVRASDVCCRYGGENEALYQAKSAGRNRTVVAPALTSLSPLSR